MFHRIKLKATNEDILLNSINQRQSTNCIIHIFPMGIHNSRGEEPNESGWNRPSKNRTNNSCRKVRKHTEHDNKNINDCPICNRGIDKRAESKKVLEFKLDSKKSKNTKDKC